MKKVTFCLRYAIAVIIAVIGMGMTFGTSDSIWVTIVTKPIGIILLLAGMALTQTDLKEQSNED